MYIFLPNVSEKKIGGGFTFRHNFIKGMNQIGVGIAERIEDADGMLISGATMVDRKQVNEALKRKIPIIFRVDNIPRDSRNRGTAISRMKEFSKIADVVVYQSEWAKNYAGIVCGDGTIIYNGVDTDIFKREGTKEPKNGETWLYVRSSRDENKRFPEAQYMYHMAWRDNPLLNLWIVGVFGESINYNFDFFQDEPIAYFGVPESKERMAVLYRSADALIYPSYADSAPNVINEAMACGLKVIGVNPIGGTVEYINKNINGDDMSLKRMCQEYRGLFQILLNGVKEVEI